MVVAPYFNPSHLRPFNPCLTFRTFALFNHTTLSVQNNLIFGRHPVIDAIKSGKTIDKVILQQDAAGEMAREIRKLCKTRFIPVQMVPKERLNRLVRGNHQGVMCWLSLIEYQKLADVLPTIYEKSEVPLILLLDGVTDVRNFGAIARSAEVLGAHAIVIPRKKSAQITPDAIKTSAGALLEIPVCREPSIIASVEYLQQSGVQVFASDLKAEKQMHEVDFTAPCALVIGAEDRGVSRSILQVVDQPFIIPQLGKTDSLNVSVATGIMLYEVLKQRT
ncbi:MAG: 23S rRNA (guanosine(2251)-2'-O)-methyltransferase RlmB [Bacteroidota bacterium]